MDAKTKMSIVENKASWGVYVWKLPDGSILGDTNKNLMNIPAMRHDLQAIHEITQAARHYGFPDGEPYFMAGQRRISDEEYSEQVDRMKQGYIPSETDIGAFADAQRGLRVHGGE